MTEKQDLEEKMEPNIMQQRPGRRGESLNYDMHEKVMPGLSQRVSLAPSLSLPCLQDRVGIWSELAGRGRQIGDASDGNEHQTSTINGYRLEAFH